MKKQHVTLLAFTFVVLTKTWAQSPGDIIITEFMANPAKVADASGEWFEVYNTSDRVIDINGWHIKDGGSKNHTVNNKGPLLISSGNFLLFALKDDTITNGGLSPNYVYSNIAFPNTLGKIILTDASGSIIDSIGYANAVSGKSWSLDPLHFTAADNDNLSYWCIGSSLYGLGDFGTPKHANAPCTISSVQLLAMSELEFRIIHNDLLLQSGNLLERQVWDIIDITGQIIRSGSIQEQTYNFSISINGLSRGFYFFRLHKACAAIKFIVE